ncbi:FUSC family protein [Streptomyces actinomycinicus]|uniref:FUSC family protein n=1 Tax=Streptomyces actinomycinicus TaxID=1695166 RepID=A0A937JNL2_9ACTN|nr:FUSC family protein [Streptomyces actinomycinicus]MBL1082512.1 FUSC family protein [Streptomyces actinomycinicus]
MRVVRWSALRSRIGPTDCAEAARATVAAGLTWQTCTTLLHTPDPYAGAVAALLIVETTVVRTASAALRYGSGCLFGLLVAVPGALYVQPAMAGLALVVLASVLLARREFLGHYGLHVPTTALITFALVRGRHPGELASHLAEIVLGIAFGLACSALLFPAVRVRSAERALEELRGLVARYLDGLADAVVRHEPPREVLGTDWEQDLDTALERARTEVDEAHESMRWNVRPTARRRHWHLDRRVLRTLSDVARQLTATGRLLDAQPAAAGAGPAFAQPYARLLRTTALCAYACRGGRPHPALPAARQALTRLGATACDRQAATAEGGRLIRPLESALSCLSAPAPAPPVRTRRLTGAPARARRLSRALHPRLRR